jgi:hypothetical protein
VEERTARNWYWWLWLSPLITIPTFFFLAEVVFWEGPRSLIFVVDYRLGRRAYLLALLVTSLWHLILLVPALNAKSEFVRWHGRQALLLAGVRTAVPLLFVLAFGRSWRLAWGLPILVAVWFSGMLLSQREAARGLCGLMRWFGRAEAQPAYKRAE